MLEKKAIKLRGSDGILVHPDESYEIKVLEIILDNATLKNMDKNELIVTMHCQRVKNFDANNPQWENVEYPVKLQDLFELYKKIESHEYKEPSLDDLKLRYKFRL